MKEKELVLTIVLALAATTAFGQIQNPSFLDPALSDTAGCNPTDDTTMLKYPAYPWDWSSGGDFNISLVRDDKNYTPGCGHPYHVWASLRRNSGQPSHGRFFQTVTLPHAVQAGEVYAFTGSYHLGGSDPTDGATAIFSVYNGTDTNMITPIGVVYTDNVKGGEKPPWGVYWLTFRATANPPVGSTSVIVACELKANTGLCALHVAATSLDLTTVCTTPPTITQLSPAMAVQGATNLSVVVTGTNLAAPATVTLTGPQTILPSSVTVNSAIQATAVFSIPSDAIVDDYTFNYTQGDCVTISRSFLVYLTQFKNGSFELPASTGCNPSPTTPTSWQTRERGEWGNFGVLALDGHFSGGTLNFLPTCPADYFPAPNNGPGYGTMSSGQSSTDAYAQAWETFAVTPSTQYSFSGYFAGSGNNTVALRLHDGGLGGDALVSGWAHSGSGKYDWYFSYITTPAPAANSGVMTAEWEVHGLDGSQNATHADNLVVEPCSAPITSLDAASPLVATNDGTVHVTITGSGFAGTPTVFLNKPGRQIGGLSILRDSATQISCNFNLTNAPAGRYEVVVKQSGCYASSAYAATPWTFAVVSPQFVNGGFTDPSAADAACPGTDLAGVPTGWLTDSNLHRDGTYPAPACPLPPGTRHYGSMSSGAPATLRAWQTILAVPGRNYRLSGYFASDSASSIKLLNGFEDGTLINSQDIYSGTPDNSWVYKVTSGTATSDVITAVWQIDAGNGGGNAAGLQLGAICHTVWADADDDGDVDQQDFSVFQQCYTGNTPPIPAEPYCQCFNSDNNAVIDTTNLVAFEQCASGPGIPVVAAGCR